MPCFIKHCIRYGALCGCNQNDNIKSKRREPISHIQKKVEGMKKYFLFRSRPPQKKRKEEDDP